MKNIRWILALLLLVVYGSVFGQSQPTKASIMEDAFGAIRAGMVKDACEILNYHDQKVIGKITNNSIEGFCTEIENRKKESNKLKNLRNIIGDARNKVQGLSGEDISDYKSKMNRFRSQLEAALNESRIREALSDDESDMSIDNRVETANTLVKRYLGENGSRADEINLLVDECECFNRDKEEYKTKYPDGRFKNVTNTTSTDNVNGNNNNGGSNSTVKPEAKNANDKDKQAWDNCEKSFESVVRFIKENPNNKYVQEADKLLWSDLESKKNATIQDYRNYLDSRINPIHKTEAEKIIKKLEQEDDLKKCNKWDSFESTLEKWKDDPAFIDEVYEKCWQYCEGREKLEDYKKYIALLEKYGGTLHYKDAEEAIKRLSTTPKKDYGYLWYLLAALAVVALLLAMLLRKRKKNQSQLVSAETELREENAAFERCSTISACDYYLNTYPNGRFVKEVIAKKEGLLDKIKKEEDDAFKACTTVTACDYYLIKYPKGRYVNEVKERKTKLAESNNPKPKPEPENKPNQEPKQKQGEWVVVGASVKGNGHIESNMPCQDNSKFEILGKGWGVAVVSDGAGSAAHSDMGSKVVVERGTLHFKNLVEKEGWMDKNTLPSDAEWLQKSYFVLKTIRNEVEMVAKKNNVDLKSLSATCLAVVFSPLGLLAVHVGDGRMGCKTAAGGWKAIMTPHKGDEANQTLFLISEFWDIPNYVQSGVLVPESIVVREPVDAFAVMSDGCESTAWLCTAQNAETGKYYDQNKPFEGFFNPLEETLASFHKDNVPEEERKEKWYKFIESGTKGFVKEQDDKTMILGVFL